MAAERLTDQHLDPELLVSRIIAELRANPEAQRLLLRALLTNEFLGMPARLQSIERDIVELKADVAELKTTTAKLEARTARLETTTAKLVNDVGGLMGSDLEMKVHRSIRPLLSHRINGADISRSRQSADTLASVFAEQALAVVVGCRIDPADRQRADAAGVRYVLTSP